MLWLSDWLICCLRWSPRVELFNSATIGECVYNLVEGRDLPVTLKPFPAYSKAVDTNTTRIFTITYIGISTLAVLADIVLLAGVKKNPARALGIFLYWNAFHFVADVFIIAAFFLAVLRKYNANEAFNASPALVFIATALRLSILGSVYQTYREYVANPNYRDSK
ncbi:hypothetical protein MRX96_019342 [Rhipicephalus microplus]